MPWKPEDAKRHTRKANTPAKKRQFSSTANAVRERAMAEGESEKEADAKAVRIANAAVRHHPSRKRR